MVKMLLIAGADVNSESNNDDGGAERTAVMIASKCGNTKIVNDLLSWNPDVDLSDLQKAHNKGHPSRTYDPLNRYVSKESKRKSNQLQRKFDKEKAEQAKKAEQGKAGVYALFSLAVAAVEILSQYKGVSFHPLGTPLAPSCPLWASGPKRAAF
jgi:hypothetical protein